MIQVRIEGKLTGLERLRFVARSASTRRRITRQIGQRITTGLKRAIRRRARASQDAVPDAAERSRNARRFSRAVAYKATADRVIVFDKGVENDRRLTGAATPAQARKMRELGFKLLVATITRRFSAGLAGLLIRELEQGLRANRKARGLSPRKRARAKRRGSFVLMVWREEHQAILNEVDVTGIVRRALAA